MMQSIIIELDSVSHENQIWFTSKHLRGIYYDLLIMICRIKYWYQERQLQMKNAKQNRKDNSSHFSTQRHWSHAIYVQKCHIGNSNNSKFTMACKTTVSFHRIEKSVSEKIWHNEFSITTSLQKAIWGCKIVWFNNYLFTPY